MRVRLFKIEHLELRRRSQFTPMRPVGRQQPPSLSPVTHGEENAQGNAEDGGVTLREAEARLRRKRTEFIFDCDTNRIHL